MTYQNSKEQQAGYQALESLLDSTSPESQQAFNILEGYTQTFISFGYDEQEARNLAGCYVSAIYLFGGISAIKASQTLVKRFGTDIAGVKSALNKANVSTGNTNAGKGKIPSIKGTQVGLRDPASVDKLKQDMLSGNFNFEADFGRIGGFIDKKGNYYVGAGHHRMVAAMEIYKTTGDSTFINKLIKNGRWTLTDKPPIDAKPLPKRNK